MLFVWQVVMPNIFFNRRIHRVYDLKVKKCVYGCVLYEYVCF